MHPRGLGVLPDETASQYADRIRVEKMDYYDDLAAQQRSSRASSSSRSRRNPPPPPLFPFPDTVVPRVRFEPIAEPVNPPPQDTFTAYLNRRQEEWENEGMY